MRSVTMDRERGDLREVGCRSEGPRHAGSSGATSIEYALLASLIAAVITAIVVLLGLNVMGLFQTIEGQF